MRFLNEGDKGAVKATDASVKNKWSWKWPDEPLQHSFDKIGTAKYTLSECIRKIDVAGTAWCLWCEDKISNGSNGKKHLVNHCSTDKHLDRLKNLTPSLKKTAIAALSIFHGPQVESSFSLMKDMMSMKPGSMSVASFSSIQTVKYYLKSKQKTSTEYFHRSSTNHTPVSRDLVKNMQHATKEYEAQQITKKQELDSETESLKVSRIIC
ncbi:hypothetical protein RRG08_029569 [Elysia crispata]|uniref:Uncharacterized protein n=1 Tax=Elysia crispata TaxID=231223 RepID=A0AAE1DF31_9GAST|nr:hypothetical protein RRG08_029569 [Elysia crispata]